MGTYRDDLEAARLRIDTLQAKLRASEARAEAAEVEARELAGAVAQLETQIGELERGAPTLITRRTRRHRLPLALGALLMVTTVGAFATARMAMQPAQPPELVTITLDELPTDAPRQRSASQPVPRVRSEPKTREGRFDVVRARAELAEASRRARQCEGAPRSRERVTVAFAPSGEVSQVTISRPHSISPAASCVRRAFEDMRLPPFEGGTVTMSQSFSIR